MRIVTFEGGYDSNFAYLVYDEISKKAVTIDPILPDEILKFIKDNNLDLIYIINTHSHFDHVEGNDKILKNTKATLLKLKDNEEITLASLKIKPIHTPGHTEDSYCILINKKALFTGDTLFVNGIGITHSVKEEKQELDSIKKILLLDESITIYPGHNYGEKKTSTIKEEKISNPFLD